MTLISVNSSARRAVSYDGHTLTVGRIYDHSGVPYSVYAAFRNAKSIGNYYSRHIRGYYR
jgi:hypothetical protein